MKRTSTSTIFRTVVFAGAMLGAPACKKNSAQPTTPSNASNGSPSTTDPVVTGDDTPATSPTMATDPCASTDPSSNDSGTHAAAAFEPTPVDAPPPAAPSAADEAKVTKAAVTAVETEMKDLDKAIANTNKSLKAAKTAADKASLTATLADQQQQKDELKAKLVTAKAEAKKADDAAKAEARANNPPRPRTQETRPVGRGFVLS